MTVEIIVACGFSENGKLVIGNDGQIPWHVPEDLQLFRRKTLGHCVVMGRKTYQSLPIKPLAQRENIIFSNQTKFHAPDCEVSSQRIPILRRFAKNPIDKCFIIGGESIYRLFLPWVSKIHLSLIDGTYTGDAFFPLDFEAVQKTWLPISVEKHDATHKSPSWKEYIYARPE